MVTRSEKVRARYTGLDGKVKRINAEDLLAQALEHEIDHLNGILYIDHLVSPDNLWKITYEPDEGEPEEGEPEEGEEKEGDVQEGQDQVEEPARAAEPD